MSKHCFPLTVPSNNDLNRQDVFGVTALTSSVDPTGNVSLALNEEEVFAAYNDSCARADESFDSFMRGVQQEADAGASAVYQEAAALNDTWTAGAVETRMVWIRICIRRRWIKIYINWHI